MKKTLAILLVVCLMFTSLFSFPAYAVDDDVNININDLTNKTLAFTDISGKYKSQGRNYLNSDGVLLVNYPANGVEFNAYCKGDVYVTFDVTNLGYKDGIGGCYFTVIVDGVTLDRETCHINETGDVTVKIAEGLAEGNHTFKLFRQNEITYAHLGLKSITLDGYLLDAPANKDMYIEVVGDSVTGGWGNLGNSSTPNEDNAAVQDATQAYAYYTAQNLDADFSSISVGGIGAYWGGNTMNTVYQYYGYFNDKKTLYDFENTRKPNYVVIGLGTNDYTKAAQNGKNEDDLLDAFKYFARLIRIKNPGAKIVWAHGVMNYNATPFIEEAVKSLGGADYGIYEVKVTANTKGVSAHSTAEGAKVIAKEISDCIEAIEAENKPFISEFPPMVYEETEGEVILESDFGSYTKWTARSNVTLVDEDNDGVKDFVRLTSSKDTHRALRSAPFTLIPGNEYELTYYVRVPEGSNEFGTNYYPLTAIYQPTLNEDGTKVADNFVDGTDGNSYAYKNVRRHDFVSTWQIGEYYPIIRKNYSGLGSAHQVASAYDSPNKVYDGWTRVTAKFTALDDANNVGNQTAALYFGFNTKADGLIYEIKDVTLKNTSVVAEEPETQKTVLTSNFGSDTNWTKRGSITYTDENSDGVKDFARLNASSASATALRSAPVQIVPGEEYELTFFARIPEESKKFQTDTYTLYPKFAMYQPTLNEDGAKVTDNHIEGKNEYAYKGNGSTTILRRADFVSTWQIGNFEPIERKRYSSFAESLYATACPGATIDEVYNGWTKVTYKFTGLPSTDNDGPETVAFYFFVAKSSNANGCFFDIKDVKLIENPNAAPETPEVPEEPVEPEEPEVPAEPIETPYISVVDTDGNQHKYGADIGAKVDVTDNADGTKTFALTYDTMDGVNTFEGWFDGETLLSTEETYTSTSGVNADNVKAKIICRNVIAGGLGFESYTEKTSLAVQPEKQGTLPYEDKWGVWSPYGKNGHYETDTHTFTRYAYYQYANPYQAVYDAETGSFGKGSRVVIRPYSGMSMFGFDARGRSIVRKLDNLKPNTEYQLSFYSYNLSKWDFLERVTVANTYDLLTKTIASSETPYTGNVKVYGYYKEPLAESGMRYSIPAIADESKVLNWNKITVNFKTDEDDTELYLHLATQNGYDSPATSYHYIDNLVVYECDTPDSFEDAAELLGAAIRRGDDKTPQALRVKFEIPNSITNIYNTNGYTLKEYGALVAYNNKLNGSALSFDTSAKFYKGVAYNKDEGINKVFETTATGSVVSFALYNIGVKGNVTDYNAYNEEIALRPYSIFVDANGNELIYYADTTNVAVFDVVDAILSQPVNSNNLTGYLFDVITARNILSGKAYDAYKAAGRNNFSQNDALGGLTITDLGENLPIHTALQAEYLNGDYANIANYAGGTAELSRPLPITFNWNDANSTGGTLCGYLLTVSENSDLSNPLVYATANNSIDIYNLKIGTTYYWNVTAIYSDGVLVSDVDNFSTEATGPRNLYISGTTNARDLGGWTINGKQTNQGVIFRCSQLDFITVEGRNTLINQLGVKTEIDIRESEDAVNTLPDDLNYYAFHTKSHIFTASKDTIIKFFGVLGNKANYPIIYHCKIGTDRTGMMSFLLNSLLGASEEQLYTDYLYSNFGYIGGARDCGVIDSYLEVINAAEGETFAEKTYNYLQQTIGVNPADMDTFIRMMTK